MSILHEHCEHSKPVNDCQTCIDRDDQMQKEMFKAGLFCLYSALYTYGDWRGGRALHLSTEINGKKFKIRIEEEK